MLEQLRIATNRRDDEVVIGVTLKNITGYDKIDEDYMKDERSGLKIIYLKFVEICFVIKSLNRIDVCFLRTSFKVSMILCYQFLSMYVGVRIIHNTA
jgi:hypothetical protein